MSLAQLITRLSIAAPAWLPAAADVAVKSVAILAVTGVATIAMRRASAAARHLVWLLGLASLLGLPILSAALPAWHVLPAWATPGAPGDSSGETIAIDSPPSPQSGEAEEMPARANSGGIPKPRSAVLESDNDSPIAPDRRASPPATRDRPSPTPAAASIRLSWQAWTVLAWAGGSLLLLARILLGLASLHRLGRRSDRITDSGALALLCELSAQLRLRRRVELLASQQRTMPMVWGIFRIRLLLPAGALDWTAEQSRAVLLHELAHAKRGDTLWQPLTQFVRALYWFNPLAHLACRQMQAEREMACDDLVLSAGARPSAYAEQLLTIAAEMPMPRSATAAIAMARPSALEGRLRAILDKRKNRKSLTVATTLVAALAALLVTSCVAVLFGTNPKPLSATVTFVTDPDGRPSAKPFMPIALDAADAAKLAAFFPEMGRSSNRAGSWMSGAEIVFHYPNGRSATVTVSIDDDNWSEGHGDWEPNGDLAAFLAKLRQAPEEAHAATHPAAADLGLGLSSDVLKFDLAKAQADQAKAETAFHAAMALKMDPEKLRKMAGPAIVAQLDPSGQLLRTQDADIQLQVSILKKKGYTIHAPAVVQLLAAQSAIHQRLAATDAEFAKAYLAELAKVMVEAHDRALQDRLLLEQMFPPKVVRPDTAPAFLIDGHNQARASAGQAAPAEASDKTPIDGELSTSSNTRPATTFAKPGRSQTTDDMPTRKLGDAADAAKLQQIQAQANYDAAVKWKGDPQKLREMAGPALVAQLDPKGQTLRGEIGDVELQIDLLKKKGYGVNAPPIVQDNALLDELRGEMHTSDKAFAAAYVQSLLLKKQHADEVVQTDTKALKSGVMPTTLPQPSATQSATEPAVPATRPTAESKPGAAGDFPKLPNADLEEIVHAASATLDTARRLADFDGTHIPRTCWAPAIAALRPLEVEKRRGNIQIVLSRQNGTMRGLVAAPLTSSTIPASSANETLMPLVKGDDGFLHAAPAESSDKHGGFSGTTTASSLYTFRVTAPATVPATAAASQPTTQSARATLTVHLLDERGQPMGNRAPSGTPVSVGYSPHIAWRPIWSDKGGTFMIHGIAPGRHWFVFNSGSPEPTIVSVDVPNDGMVTSVRIKNPNGPRPEPDLSITPRVEQKDGRYSLHVSIASNTDRPYTLSATDLQLNSSNERVFPPSTQSHQGAVVPAKGKGKLELTLDWDTYLKRGLWGSRSDEFIDDRWPGTPPGKGMDYYRVDVCNTGSLPVALPQPPGAPPSEWLTHSFPATAPATQPGAATTKLQ